MLGASPPTFAAMGMDMGYGAPAPVTSMGMSMAGLGEAWEAAVHARQMRAAAAARAAYDNAMAGMS